MWGILGAAAAEERAPLPPRRLPLAEVTGGSASEAWAVYSMHVQPALQLPAPPLPRNICEIGEGTAKLPMQETCRRAAFVMGVATARDR